MSPTPRDEWTNVGDLSLHYRDWGGSGQPVVLLHGLASTCHIWDLVAPLLSRDFSVVAVDQRGHGDSGKPEDGYDFPTVAEDLRGFLEALGIEHPVLVGHSWGGNVALEFVTTDPGAAKGMCLVDGGTIEISAVPGMTLERSRVRMAPPDFTGMTLERLKERWESRDWGFDRTPEIEQIVLSNFHVLDDGSIRPKFPRESHMKVVDAFWTHKPSTLYSRVTCPALLMPARMNTDGADEEAVQRRAAREESIKRADGLLPVSKVRWLEDSIHDVPLQRPKLVADIITEHITNGFFG